MKSSRPIRCKFKATKTVTAALLISIAVTGCASTGDISNFFTRKATWFNFISGEDIAKNCQPGGDHMRLVYNADRAVQVRVYDLSGSDLRAQVLNRSVNLKNIPLLEADTVLSPSRRDATLSAAKAEQIRASVAADMNGSPLEPGHKLFSGSTFWLAASCQDGQFRFAAWEHPDTAFNDLSFPDQVFAVDPSVETIERPRHEERVTAASLRTFNKEAAFEHYDLTLREDRVTAGRSYPVGRNY